MLRIKTEFGFIEDWLVDLDGNIYDPYRGIMIPPTMHKVPVEKLKSESEDEPHELL